MLDESRCSFESDLEFHEIKKLKVKISQFQVRNFREKSRFVAKIKISQQINHRANSSKQRQINKINKI